MAHPFALKEKAIVLRNRGHSLKEISKELHIVKSTAAIWVHDVTLDAVARERLFKHTKSRHFFNAEKRKAKTRALEQRYFEEALAEVRSNPNHEKIMCAMLYWCEGGKTVRNGVRFTNSDPRLVTTFLKLFRSSFKLDENKFHPCIHIHEYHSAEVQLDFWSKITDIDKQQFIRPYRKPNTGRRIRTNYQGCISISYHSADLARRLMAIAKAYMYMGV